MEFTKEINILLSGLTSLIIVALSIPSIIKVARAKNLYDVPDSRKSHRNSVPTLGGLAIFAGLIIAVLLWTDFKSNTEIKYVLAAVILIFFIGLKDDILIIAADKKLIVQIVASLMLAILGDIRITNLHGFAGIHEIPYLVSLVITIFVTIVVLNGMNLIDGIDGLASGIGIITSVTFGIYFYLIGQIQYVIFMAALIGALGAFFIFNVFGRKNKIFMGDTGSLIVGLILAVFAIKFNEFNLSVETKYHFSAAPSISIGIMMIPLFDTLRVFLIRVLKGKSPFRADKNHVHHRLLQIGCSHLKATSIIVMTNVLFIFTSFAFSGIGLLALLLLNVSIATLLSFIPMLILNAQNNKYSKLPIVRKPLFNNFPLLMEDRSDQYFIFDSELENKKRLEEEKVKVS